MPRRAALLQCPGDPFILAYWLRNYGAVWKDEVDELRIFVNGTGDGPVLDYCREAAQAAGAIFTSQPGRLVHGQATEILLHSTEADSVMLIEDDAFVRVPGAVTHAFEWAEDGWVIGSPRGGMSPEVEQAAIAKWGSPQPEGPDGSSGYGLWPCFMFGPLDVMRSVAHGISSLTWGKGAVIPGLDWECPAEMTTDTATLAAFILRGSNVPLQYEGQWKELWMKQLPEMRAKAGYDPPWFHSGGLSNELFFQGGGGLGARPGIGGTNEGLDWAHRCWWWIRCLQTFPDDVLPELQEQYRAAIESAVNAMGIDDQVRGWDADLPAWITWNETNAAS